MKPATTVKQVEKRREGKKGVQTHSKHTVITFKLDDLPKDLLRDYRELAKETGEPLAVLIQTGLKRGIPALAAQQRKESDESKAFQKWIESAPDMCGEDQLMAIWMPVRLHCEWWLNLRRIAQVNQWTFTEAVHELLAESIENYKMRKEVAEAKMEAWNSATTAERRAMAANINAGVAR